MKAQRDEGGGKILLGDNTGVETVMLGPIRLQCAGIRKSAGHPFIYIHSWPYDYSIPTGAKLAGSYGT
jgi:hypothetical protein